MCGRELEPEGDLVEEPVQEPVAARPVPAHAEAPRPVASAPPAPSTPAPAYTGGIFNLGGPAEQKSRNLDYLLEDDEPRSHKGIIFFVVALALALGLGYMRFQETGIPGFRTFSHPTQSAPPNASPLPSNGPENSTVTPPPSAGTADQPPTAQPSASTPPSAAAPSPSTPSAATPTTTASPANTPTLAAPAGAAPDSSGATTATNQDSGGSSTAPPARTPTQPPAPKEAAPEKPADQEPPAPAAAVAPRVEAPAPEKPAKKPVAKPPAAKAEDSITLGEKYLYGRGVPQSCEKGLHYVKPAADQSNPKAMITMGALYATGHCLSRDLPTAYRYFALALRLDPENSALKQNAEMVWGQMTPSERQLAIRLTQ